MLARNSAKRVCRAFQKAQYATQAGSLAVGPSTSITRHESGLRIATSTTEGRFPAVGLYIDVGSRYETPATEGSTQLLDKLAFQGTQNRTPEECMTQLVNYGGQFAHISNRDGAIMEATLTHEHVEGAVDLMLDTTFAPLLTEELVASQVEAALYDNQMALEKPEIFCNDLINEVAWQGNTLGNPYPASSEALRSRTPEALSQFHQAWYRPERMVVAAVGVEHEPFVALVNRLLERYLPSKTGAGASSRLASAYPGLRSAFRTLSTTSSLSATASDQVDAVTGESSVNALAAQRPLYTGGERIIEDANAEFTRLIVAYESLPLHDPDLYALAVLSTLLGGGPSFSSGGPGKGMYSRFYANMLARYHVVDYCSSLHNIYADASIFGVHIAVRNDAVHRLGPLVREGLTSALVSPKAARWNPFDKSAESEVARARNQLLMQLLQALESRQVQVEDLGRQVMQMGRREPDEEMFAKIQAVTLADVQRVAERVLRHGKPSILAHGQVAKLGDIQKQLREAGLGGRF